ncbi:hypothetical protein Tco_0782275 [Tanacetum coccineum]
MAFGVFSTSNSYSSYSYYDFKDDECMISEETVESKLNNAGEVVDEVIQLMTVADHENVLNMMLKVLTSARKSYKIVVDGKEYSYVCDIKKSDLFPEGFDDNFSVVGDNKFRVFFDMDAEKLKGVSNLDDLKDQMKFAFQIEADRESVISLGTLSICAQLSNDISSKNKLIDELRGLRRSEVINMAIAFWINLRKDDEAKLELGDFSCEKSLDMRHIHPVVPHNLSTICGANTPITDIMVTEYQCVSLPKSEGKCGL